jgi:hypothetical protein
MKAVQFNYVRSNRTAEYIQNHRIFDVATHAQQLKAAKAAVKACENTLRAVAKIGKDLPTYDYRWFKHRHPFLNLAIDDLNHRIRKEYLEVEHTLHQLQAIQQRIENFNS